MTIPDNPYQTLIDRIGEPHFSQRINLQVNHASRIFDQGRTLIHIENVEWLMVFIYYSLKVVGIYDWGHRNFKNVQIVKNTVPLHNLPKAFDGYRILHLSDLHLDLAPSLTDVILEKEGQTIYLSGIDDPHFYKTDNLHLAHAAIPTKHTSILLAHSPDDMPSSPTPTAPAVCSTAHENTR